jgi:8-oxo-dGTP pyrophosphatase MutT (NUDIX family)
MHQGGVRELAEETGVEAKKLKFLGSRRVESEMNKPVDVSMYEYNHGDDDPRPHGRGDPDKEVSKWEWFSHKEPLSDEVLGNLKHANNIALDYMGLLK